LMVWSAFADAENATMTPHRSVVMTQVRAFIDAATPEFGRLKAGAI
jgi:hypothetical protein